jgi:hypothetical protein
MIPQSGNRFSDKIMLKLKIYPTTRILEPSTKAGSHRRLPLH